MKSVRINQSLNHTSRRKSSLYKYIFNRDKKEIESGERILYKLNKENMKSQRFTSLVVRKSFHKQCGKRLYSTTSGDELFLNKTQDDKVRINPVGIQCLSSNLRDQIFKQRHTIPKSLNNSSTQGKEKDDSFLYNLASKSLKHHNLLGKKTSINKPIEMDLPELQGNSLEEHFQKIGHYMAEPYLSMAKSKFSKIIPKPEKWELNSGSWIRYVPGCKPEKVEYPLENLLVFDVETLPKISPYPILATALSEKAWYSWCSPFLTYNGNENNNKKGQNFEHLIPLNTQDPKNKKLIIGHNVAYDRARVLEEYNFKTSNAFFLDTLSLHLGTSGMCSRQRAHWQKATKVLRSKLENSESEVLENDLNDQSLSGLQNQMNNNSIDTASILKDDPWVNVTTLNSLKECALFYCGIELKKDARDIFVNSENKQDVIAEFQKLCDYCADDVIATSMVFDKVFPNFLDKAPHPVSFAALKMVSQCFLPTNKKQWDQYITRSENLYQKSNIEIENKIIDTVEDILKLKDQPEIYTNDPWLKQLDWTITPLKLTKKGVPYKKQKLPGFPNWYKSLFPTASTEKPSITIRSREVPLFFKISWENKPVVWSKENGWCFDVVDSTEIDVFLKEKNYQLATGDEDKIAIGKRFKVPHPNGAELRTTTLLSKPFIHQFEKGILSSKSPLAIEALEIRASGSYWMSSRQRIMNQWVVPKKHFPDQFRFNQNDNRNGNNDDLAIILPNLLPMGTVTRRAVENCWLTASNAKKNRIGSELKSLVQAPDGYCFVGADVDSEELWIASLVGDSIFKMHGGTPIGWMCLEGTKNEGTDLHTKTAQILGCTRNEAKIFNYGRIYGAGVKFAAQLLKQFVPSKSETETLEVATDLYKETKGNKIGIPSLGQIWYGGSESVLFNKLEQIANQDQPKTPILGASITNSLLKGNLKKNSYLPSRINWVIQSSGVDYLHLLCCSMNYLIDKYKIDARMIISIHDEIRFLVKEEDKYRGAMALQISNIWTRSMFCEQLGMDDLPQNCAFFSAVDIDLVLRKEVDLDCITPSNQVAIPHGESLDIYKLMEKESSKLGRPDEKIDLSNYQYVPREKEIDILAKKMDPLLNRYLISAQVQNNKRVVGDLIQEYKETRDQQKFMKEYGEVFDETLDFNDSVRKKKCSDHNQLLDTLYDVNRPNLENASITKKEPLNSFSKKQDMEKYLKKRTTRKAAKNIDARNKLGPSRITLKDPYLKFMSQQSNKTSTPSRSEQADMDAINEILQSSLQVNDYNPYQSFSFTERKNGQKSKRYGKYDEFIKNQNQKSNLKHSLAQTNHVKSSFLKQS